MPKTAKPSLPVELLGWYGAGAIVLAYMLVSFGVIQAEGLLYQLLNLTGAGGIIAISWARRDVQPVALNIFWVVIAIAALIRLFFV